MRPTREGRTGADRAGLIFKGIGVDPDTETTDPEPAPDQAAAASGAQAFVAYLPPPDPTVTDLNLAFGTDSDGGGNRPVVNPTFVNDGNLSTLAYRTSFYNGGGTKTWWVKADLGAAYDVDEIVIRGGLGNSEEFDPPWEIAHSPDGTTWTTAVGTYVWTPTGSPRTATLTLTSTQTKRYWRVGHTITYTGLVYPVKIHTFAINGDPGAVDPTNIIFIDGPLTIDDDDTTYEQVLTDAIADEVWRVTLQDSYLISSINLRIGFENAGAVTLLLQAGNESDYSDAATIETLTATGTGSFTAQDITASFTPTAVYQYWQLLLTSTAQDIHIHTVNLFGPTDPTGVHGDLTGLEDPDQHPADSITFTPYSTLAATNVQAAIQELLNEASASVGAGTSFPGSPSTNLRFYRTDLALEFYYDGTRWLSTMLGQIHVSASDVVTPFSASGGGQRASVPANPGSDIWLVAYRCWFFVNGGTALSGSHKWTGVTTTQPANTTVITVIIDSGASSTYRQATGSIGALVGSTNFTFSLGWTKVGTPGTLFTSTNISFRYVAT